MMDLILLFLGVIIVALMVYLGYYLFIGIPQEERDLDNECQSDCSELDYNFLQRTYEGCFCYKSNAKKESVKIWE